MGPSGHTEDPCTLNKELGFDYDLHSVPLGKGLLEAEFFTFILGTDKNVSFLASSCSSCSVSLDLSDKESKSGQRGIEQVAGGGGHVIKCQSLCGVRQTIRAGAGRGRNQSHVRTGAGAEQSPGRRDSRKTCFDGNNLSVINCPGCGDYIPDAQ